MPHLFYTPPPPDMGEWQIDEHGQRFRQVGKGCVEYEMEFDHPHIIEKSAPPPPDDRTGKECPFNQAATMERPCRTSCALYRPTGCAMQRREAAQDTKGKNCPFLRTCTENCALYSHGCAL